MSIEELVNIIARRIVNDEINPKTGKPYKIEDVTNTEIRPLVEARIKEMQGGI